MRKLHVKFLIGSLTVLGLCGLGAFLVHEVQMRRNAAALLTRARSAEAAGELREAEETLSLYLGIKGEDSSAWIDFARVTDDRARNPRDRERVYLVCEEALRKNPGNRKLERRCAELAMDLERRGDARRHLKQLEDSIQADPARAVEVAELEDLLGQCDQGELKPADAEQHLRKAIALDSTRVGAHDRLARLLRQDLKNPVAADQMIEGMLKANPKSALARVHHWRYRREFGPAAEPSDIELALVFGPDETEVLIAAAENALDRKDPVKARRHLERGLEVHPRSDIFYRMAADLEREENHPERAEAVFRRGVAAIPENVPLRMLLTETLIDEQKLDGDEGALAWIEQLRKERLANGLVQFLEGRVAVVKQQWPMAISKFEMSRSLLADNSVFLARINLLLADCHAHTGETEKQFAALEKAASVATTAGVAGPLLARTLESEGRVDDAINVHRQLLERRPQSRLDLARLLIRKNVRLPQGQRRWQEVEQRLQEAKKVAAGSMQELTLLCADLLAAQNRVAEARKLLATAQADDPHQINYRLALARLAQSDKDDSAPLQVLDQAEKDLGPSVELQLARLEIWGRRDGDAASAALAKLAETRNQFPAESRTAFLDRLVQIEVRRGELAPARQYCRELSELEPANLQVLMVAFDLALQADDDSAAELLINKIRTLEGNAGATWRFAQAALALERARRGNSKELSQARALASEIGERRPNWWGQSILSAEISEIEGNTDEAIRNYRRAFQLGYRQSATARRLVALLNEEGAYDQIDEVVSSLNDRGMPAEDLIMSTAIGALRQRDLERAVSLARRGCPEGSTSFADHLILARVCLAASRLDEAGKEFRRTLELAPGVPVVWVSYVSYLVQTKQANQAKAAVERAAKALPAGRSGLALAECYALAGDFRRSDEQVQAALKSPTCNPAMVRAAVDLYMSRARFDQVEPIVAMMFDPALRATPEDLAWASRTRCAVALDLGPAGRSRLRAGSSRQESQDRSLQHSGPEAQSGPAGHAHQRPWTSHQDSRKPAGLEAARHLRAVFPGSAFARREATENIAA